MAPSQLEQADDVKEVVVQARAIDGSKKEAGGSIDRDSDWEFQILT